MKIFLRSFVLMALFTVVFPMLPAKAEEAAGGLRYSITVSQFENRSGWYGSWDIGDAWGTVLTDMLTQTGRFIVLGETDMRYAAMDEQDFAASGRTASGKKAPVTGQMTPAQLLVKGAITHAQGDTGGAGGGFRIKGIRIGGGGGKGEVNATIYIVDSTTGQVLASKSVVGTHERKSFDIGYSSYDWGAAGRMRGGRRLPGRPTAECPMDRLSGAGQRGQGLRQSWHPRGRFCRPDLYRRASRGSA